MRYKTNYQKNKNRNSILGHLKIREYCYLCGGELSKFNSQKEHVIPKFIIGNIHSLILSSCNTCNQSKGRVEERIKYLLGILVDENNLVPVNNIVDTIKNNKQDNRQGLTKKYFYQMSRKYITTDSGIITPKIVFNMKPKDNQDIKDFFLNITKGLYTYYEDNIIDWDVVKIELLLFWNKFDTNNEEISDSRSIYEDWKETFNYIRTSSKYSTIYKFKVYSQINAMVEIMTPFLDKQDSNELQSKKLAKLKDSLLPQLISGKINV